MTIRRVTISMPEKLARKVKKAAGKKPVSAWISEILEREVDEAELERLWKQHFVDVPMTAEERRRGDELFEQTTRPRRRRRAA